VSVGRRQCPNILMCMTCIKQLEEGKFFQISKCDTTHPSIQPFDGHHVC
jgi:hypothetical protein